MNWGKGITIALVAFIGFIVFLGVTLMSKNVDLVAEDYYQQELKVQGNIEKKQNANALEQKVKISKSVEGITIEFPSDFDFQAIKGKVSLYRPSNQKLDFEIPISLSTSHLLIPKSNLVGGLWDITIEWEYNEVDYLNKESVYY